MFLVLGIVFTISFFLKHEEYDITLEEGLDDYFHAIDSEHKK